MVIFNAAERGTSPAEWTESGRLAALPALNLRPIAQLVVIAAHPDDETLGAGGLIAESAARGIPTTVVVVTDGAASNPKSAVSPTEIAEIRARELREAVAELAPAATVIELGFPDGQTEEYRRDIAAALARVVPRSATIAAPWRGDGHRDHRVVGELCAALAAMNRVLLLECPIWMWHWGSPADPRVPWANTRTLRLSRAATAAKRLAISRHGSQVSGLGDGPGDAAVLTNDFLAHFQRDREVFIVTSPSGSRAKPQSYFDDLYARNGDPWRLSTRWYESRKRAISLASLPRERYASALEIGCSVGELTAGIADRADTVLAIDISDAAVEAATTRTRELTNVRVEHRDAIKDFPDGQFDLIVLSEVGYYWDLETLKSVLAQIIGHLASDATVLACHWRHPVADYPVGGDDVHAVVRAEPSLHRIGTHKEQDFVLDVFATNPDSVATREGFVS